MASATFPVGYRPPSPSVEDEAESLAREVTGRPEPRNNAYSDTSVPFRGSVDQSPVIIALDAKVSTTISEKKGQFLTEFSTNLSERERATKTKGGVHNPRKNKVRFSDSLHEPSRESSTDTTERAHQLSRSQTTVSTRQVSRSISRRNYTSENNGCLPGVSSDTEDRHRKRRPSSWYIPQEQTFESGPAPENRLEWFSDDETSSSHRGPYWRDRAPYSPRMKRMINHRPHEATSLTPSPSMARRESQDQDGYLDARTSDREEPESALVPWVGNGKPIETPTSDESGGSCYSKSREHLGSDLDSFHLGSDNDSCRQLTTRMPPHGPSPRYRDMYSTRRGRFPERQLSYPSPDALPTAIRSRSSTVPAGQLRSPQPDAQPIYLPPCPRSIPIVTRDWYTITELTHLDICPGCAHQIGRSRFRDILIPGPPKPSGTRTRCIFSQPWARLAWVQTIKLGLNHLELLYQITRPTAEAERCSGWSSTIQTWYRASDPETGRVFPDFNACSWCFRKLQILIPGVRGSFVYQTLCQRRTCDLWTNSPRFVRYVDLLDTAITRSLYDPDRYVDLREFMRYARCKSMLDDCPRDHLILSSWHYIPELPEFTVCEDCYDDVVLPISQLPIANKISCTLRPLPGSRPPHGETQQASCQLYSPRMRAMFREAVRRGDSSFLQAAALRRYDAEQAFRDRKKRLLREVARGCDRDMELRRNADQWKHSE